MFDDVSLYQKHGIVELYGLSLRPRHARTNQNPHHRSFTSPSRAQFVVWSPDYSPVGTADRLTLDAGASLPATVAFRVGIVSADDRVYLFERRQRCNAGSACPATAISRGSSPAAGVRAGPSHAARDQTGHGRRHCHRSFARHFSARGAGVSSIGFWK